MLVVELGLGLRSNLLIVWNDMALIQDQRKSPSDSCDREETYIDPCGLFDMYGDLDRSVSTDFRHAIHLSSTLNTSQLYTTLPGHHFEHLHPHHH